MSTPVTPRRSTGLWRVLVPIACIIAGILFSTSAKLTKEGEIREEVRDAATLIREGNKTVEERTATVRALQAEIAELEAKASPGSREVQKLEQQSSRLAPAVGTAALKGPGLTVTMSDSPLKIEDAPPGVVADDLVIHQSDIQSVVNALWAGGAEGVMIMDKRVINTTAIRCVGNTLLLQGQVYSPPYTVTAIGDQARLQAALDADPGVQLFRDVASQYSLGYKVEPNDSIAMLDYAGSLEIKYAKVVA